MVGGSRSSTAGLRDESWSDIAQNPGKDEALLGEVSSLSHFVVPSAASRVEMTGPAKTARPAVDSAPG